MIDQLAKQLFDNVQQGLKDLGSADSVPATQLKAVIESGLRKCNVVTREEFDTQQAVLARTREKVDTLEKQLGELLDAQSSQTN